MHELTKLLACLNHDGEKMDKTVRKWLEEKVKMAGDNNGRLTWRQIMGMDEPKECCDLLASWHQHTDYKNSYWKFCQYCGKRRPSSDNNQTAPPRHIGVKW